MIRILHLYPQLMNLYGDYGNLVVLSKHLNDLGLESEIVRCEPGDDLRFTDFDFVYMGSGSETSQSYALTDLLKYRNELKEYIDNEGIVLFTGNALELLGEKIDEQEALKIFTFKTTITDRRYTGDVILNSAGIGEVVGFINRSSLLEGGEADKLFTYEFRGNDLKDNDFEGYHRNNCYLTHVIGPVLVKNPSFLNLFVRLLSKDAYREINYEYEEKAYEVTLRELRKRI